MLERLREMMQLLETQVEENPELWWTLLALDAFALGAWVLQKWIGPPR